MSVAELQLPSGSMGPESDLDVLERAAAAVSRTEWADRANAGLGADLLQLTRVERLVMSSKVRLLGAFDASGEYRADLHPSASTWWAAKTKGDRRRVTHQVGVARTMRSMPLVEDAFRDASIGFEHVAVLARVWAPAFAAEFAEAEAELVSAAQTLDFDVFYRAALAWRDFVDPEGAEERARKQMERRQAHASRTLDGMVRVDAWLDAIGGTEFLAELHRIEKQLFEADWAEAREAHGDRATKLHLGRTSEQRRADALVEMARRSNTCEHPAQPPKWVLNLMMGYATFCAEAAAATGDHGPGCTCGRNGDAAQGEAAPTEAADPPDDGEDLSDLSDLDDLVDLVDLEDLIDSDELTERQDLADLQDLAHLTDRQDPASGGGDPAAEHQLAQGSMVPSRPDERMPPPEDAPRPGMMPPRSPLPDWWRKVDPRPGAGLADTAMYDRMCELEDYTQLAPSQALSLGLAGTIRLIVFGPDSHILDFGEAVDYFTGPLREAIIIRDRECRDHGCSVPGRDCDIDHVIPRSKGGPTSERNGRCECSTANRVKGNRMPGREPRRD